MLETCAIIVLIGVIYVMAGLIVILLAVCCFNIEECSPRGMVLYVLIWPFIGVAVCGWFVYQLFFGLFLGVKSVCTALIKNEWS